MGLFSRSKFKKLYKKADKLNSDENIQRAIQAWEAAIEAGEKESRTTEVEFSTALFKLGLLYLVIWDIQNCFRNYHMAISSLEEGKNTAEPIYPFVCCKYAELIKMAGIDGMLPDFNNPFNQIHADEQRLRVIEKGRMATLELIPKDPVKSTTLINNYFDLYAENDDNSLLDFGNVVLNIIQRQRNDPSEVYAFVAFNFISRLSSEKFMGRINELAHQTLELLKIKGKEDSFIFVQIVRALTIAKSESNDLESAISLLQGLIQNTIENNPNNQTVLFYYHLSICDILMLNDKIEDLKTWCNELLEYSIPTDLDEIDLETIEISYYSILGRVRIEENKISESQQCFRKLAEISSQDSDKALIWLMYLTDAFLEKDHFDEVSEMISAIEACAEKADNWKELCPEFCVLKAKYYRKKGKLDQAEEVLFEGISFLDDENRLNTVSHEMLLLSLGAVYTHVGNDAAEDVLLSALSMAKELEGETSDGYGAVVFRLACLKAKDGKQKLSAKLLNKATELIGENGELDSYYIKEYNYFQSLAI